jgi:hypothetical protein
MQGFHQCFHRTSLPWLHKIALDPAMFQGIITITVTYT